MNPIQHVLIFAVRVYRCALSPVKNALLGPAGRCRFTPTCSAYALQAITRHGSWRGTWLATTRLCRCHPWGSCGFDPVPPAADGSSRQKSDGRSTAPPARLPMPRSNA